MPYTTNKRLSVQAAGSNSGTWGAGGSSGDDLNTGVMELLDTQLAGSSAFSVSSSNVTLSYAEVQTCRFAFTGTLLANITVSPDTGGAPIAASFFNGFYFFSNTTSGSFTITLQNAHGSVVLPQGRRGVVYVNTAASIAPQIVGLVGSGTADPIPSGTNMLFYNASVPSGWSAVALNDYAIKVVTNATTGGTTTGSVLYSTLFGRTATDAHTLTTADTPSHQHFGFAAVNGAPLGGFSITASNYGTASAIAGGTDYQYGIVGTATVATVGLTSAIGSGGSHTHNIDMRVFTAHCIIGQRN